MDTTFSNPVFDGHNVYPSSISTGVSEIAPAFVKGNNQSTNKSSSFAGIPTETIPGVAWSSLEWEPSPVATVRIALPGGLWNDNALLEKSVIKQIAAPVLSKIDSLFSSMTMAFGVTTPVLSVSPTCSNIIVLAAHVQTNEQSTIFASKLGEIMEAVRIDAKLVAKLASLPGEEFSKAWFHLAERPDEAVLPALLASFELETLLKKNGVYLEVAGHAIDLPSCQGIKLTKIGNLPIERTGYLCGLQAKPQSVCVEISNSGKLLKLRAYGKGVVEEFGRNFTIGDPVKVTYLPKVELLKPFDRTPSGGQLKALEHA